MWGTCLGFELLCVLASGLKNEELLESCDAENYSIPLEFIRGKTITNNYSNLPYFQPRSQGLFPGLGAGAPPPSQGKVPENEVAIFLQYNATAELYYWISGIRLIVFSRVFLLQDVTRLRGIENSDFMC